MRHRVNGRWPCKRTALVLRDGQVGGGTRAHAGAIRCSAWLQATWTQPVDIVRWDALLRSEVEACSVVVLEAGVVPQERCEAVLVALSGGGGWGICRRGRAEGREGGGRGGRITG